ncbi:MAG: ABC transporter ATP-binding protein [Bacteroidales bacterium]|nr:ABC transporter ATP-binding protein [Bacteroidales bacterium]
MKQKTIDIKSLTIGYKTRCGAKIVAKDINTKLFSGELTCILGANGVGKSTLLKTLSSFIPKIEGQINILGKDIETYSEQSIATKISVVLTEKCDVHNMSVRELVSMGRSPYTGFWGKLRKEDEEIIEKSMEEVKIDHMADKMIDTLSDGERQKTMLAKALAQDTPIIFLDEPTAFLDFPSKVEIMLLIHHIARHKAKTLFVSTHDLELALQLADRIWLMDKNGITVGTPEDLSLRGNLSHFFPKKDINFDMNTGLFRLSANYHSKIKLVGDGQKYLMIKKALQRNGIEASRDIEQDMMFIESGNLAGKGIIVHISKEKFFEVKSIDAMLDLIIKH